MSASSTASPRARWNGSTSAGDTVATSRRRTPCVEKPGPARCSSAGRCARGWITCLVTPEQFLFHEARLLDTQRYEEWLQLFTEDATYWVPLEQGQKDPYQTSSIIHDDRTLLELRVKQIRHPRAHARNPLARTVHQVSNVMPLEKSGNEVRIASTLTLTEFRNEKQRVYRALVEHRLRPKGDTFQIAHKRVDLVNSEGELDGIAILF